tara:strand:- start:205 stop:651 length:447 start_codon:yes stop_codon:yes gene_type:complete
MKLFGTLLTALLLIGTLSSFDSAKEADKSVRLSSKLNIKKSVSEFNLGDELMYKVEVNINNASGIKGFAKYEDLIPAGFTVVGMHSDFGQASFDSERAKVTFLTMNHKKAIKIIYYLQGELEIQPNSVSMFSYVSGNEMSRLKITATN